MNRTTPLRRTPLRAMSEQREQKLRDAGLVPVTTFRPRTNWQGLNRKPMKATRRSASDQPDPSVIEVVTDRDNASCVACGFGVSGIRGVDYSYHHRKRRSQGGENTPPTLILACGHGTAGCHGLIHARPEWARGHGWLVRHNDDPATVPMDHAAYGGQVLLTLDGRAVPIGIAA